MIRIDQHYRSSNQLYYLQILIEYPLRGAPSDYFDKADERNIGYWQVISKANEAIVLIPVFSKGKGTRALTEEELTNGRWWIRKNRKDENQTGW